MCIAEPLDLFLTLELRRDFMKKSYILLSHKSCNDEDCQSYQLIYLATILFFLWPITHAVFFSTQQRKR